MCDSTQPVTAMVRRKLLEDPDSVWSGVAVAGVLRLKYSTLMRELNPDDSRAKLGVETFAELITATGRYDMLEELAELVGYPGRFCRRPARAQAQADCGKWRCE